MIASNFIYVVVTISSFISFHARAHSSSTSNDDGEYGGHTSKRSSGSATVQTGRRLERDAYQQPVLSNPHPPLTEDWVPDQSWPEKKARGAIGQVGGVSINARGEVFVFHRGSHVWDSQAFDHQDQYMQKEQGPISTPTVLVFHPETGALLHQWGENMFYLPHGITVDQEENIWLTDVAMHQVFKFPPISHAERTPLLALGKAFVPGNSAVQFCKPTSTAVTSWGDFFVADGYCNSRLIKFNKAGEKIMEIGHTSFTFGLIKPDPFAFNIPHALTLVEDRKEVCVADRENGRVLCFNWNNGTFASEISSPQIGSLIYSVTYSPVQGGLFYLVNGPTIFSRRNGVPVRGFVVSATNQRLLSYFGPQLQMPHDLAVSADGRYVFVGEIGPDAVHKYVHNGTLGPAALPQAAKVVLAPESPQSLSQYTGLKSPQGSVLPAVLVTFAAILFGAAIIAAALVYSRARRRGMSEADKAAYPLESRQLVLDEDI